jgi:hypothetical protein
MEAPAAAAVHRHSQRVGRRGLMTTSERGAVRHAENRCCFAIQRWLFDSSTRAALAPPLRTRCREFAEVELRPSAVSARLRNPDFQLAESPPAPAGPRDVATTSVSTSWSGSAARRHVVDRCCRVRLRMDSGVDDQAACAPSRMSVSRN